MKALDVVRLKNGQTGTLVEVFDDNNFMLEIADEDGMMIEMPIVHKEDVEQILYTA